LCFPLANFVDKPTDALYLIIKRQQLCALQSDLRSISLEIFGIMTIKQQPTCQHRKLNQRTFNSNRHSSNEPSKVEELSLHSQEYQ
jgi:hypothetical protein